MKSIKISRDTCRRSTCVHNVLRYNSNIGTLTFFAKHPQISKLQKQAAEMKKRDLIEDQLKEKKKQHGVLINKHSEALADLFSVVPESDFAVKVNKFEIKVRGEVDAIKKKLKTQDKEVMLHINLKAM